jgi:FkbM family methyltransferase
VRKIVLIILLIFDYFHKNKIINFIKNKSNKFNTIIDVGAHHGESAKLFIKKLKTKNVYCFEPSFDNYKKLLLNVKKIMKKNVYFEAFNIGLGNNKIESYLNISCESSSSSINSINEKSKYYKKKKFFLGIKNVAFFPKKEKIKILKLDDVMLSRKLKFVDLIKIDTEGHEYEVLKGSVEVLKKTRFVLFEHHYDDMLLKYYKYSHIHNFLILNSFKKIFKKKMPFRKSFDYIYENTKYS